MKRITKVTIGKEVVDKAHFDRLVKMYPRSGYVLVEIDAKGSGSTVKETNDVIEEKIEPKVPKRSGNKTRKA